MMKMRNKFKNQKGFTLVEIAIVMVIIGLLIGGILKGQGMIQNAKVKRVVKQADELRAAIMSFYDKFGMYPGDENIAAIPMGTDNEGDGDGYIENNGEEYELFQDLVLAELIDGDYNGTSDLPKHAFGGNCSVYRSNQQGLGNKLYIRYDNLPAEVCLEIDSKYDDGVRTTGSIVASDNYTAGNTVRQFYIAF